MKQKVLFVILDKYADWECAFLTTALEGHILDKTSPYEVATVSLEKAPIRSIGGFTTLPDYGLDDMPADYAALVLVGGESWRTEEAKCVAPVVRQAMADGKLVAAICDATAFLGMNGLLNGKKHTSNTLESLEEAAQDAYTNKAQYQNEQAVRDGLLITANGTGYLEFTREVLAALEAYPPDYIENNYQYFKLGFVEFLKTMGG